VKFVIFITFQVKAVYLTWNRMAGKELCECTITKLITYFLFHSFFCDKMWSSSDACLSPTTVQVFNKHQSISYKLYSPPPAPIQTTVWIFPFRFLLINIRPPLWSSGQSSWLQIQRPRFNSWHYQKKNSGYATGSTQPREYNWGATW
jgi:hypothetical protein